VTIAVLKRHESLAANLGAKLVGPLLLKSFEKLFEGPLKVTPPYGVDGASVTWLDVVEFARSNPQDFTLSDSRTGEKTCQCWIKQSNVEISEDDYRLILSGAPERMIPTHPLTEDENAEVATMEILEQRLSVLIKKADLVAGRARQLNYQLKNRKSAITNRRSSKLDQAAGAGVGSTDARSLHAELLRQFQAEDRKPVSTRARYTHPASETQTATSTPAASPTPHLVPRRGVNPALAGHDDGTGGQYRPIMAARVEKMERGSPIWPPCDRCRRLRIDCTKYLTACAGCTKKHARCAWKDIVPEEITYILQVSEPSTEREAGSQSDVHLDPGLRVGNTGGQVTAPSQGPMHTSDTYMHMNQQKRSDPLSDEHAILTQMATAAAAESNRAL
jgi:hypothetical protein